jgi:hypothetical protein
MVEGVITVVIVGVRRDTIIFVALPVHPAGFVPVTVYTVVTEGLTLMIAPAWLPGCHVYAEPPSANKVEDPPAQIVGWVFEAVMVGDGITTSDLEVEFVQLAIAPVTVYELFADGLTRSVGEITLPGNQVYELAPDAASTVEVPGQMVAGPVTEIVGVGITV